MAEPTTSNIGLIVGNTGDLVGSWATAALNPNFNVIDGIVGGILNISLSAATTIPLTTASATLTPSAGPYQSANNLITLSGTLLGNNVLTLGQSGTYRFRNNCVTGTSYVQIAPATGTGTAVGLPPGEQWHVAFDGTNVVPLGMPHVGTLHDFCMATTPVWMSAFSVAPYLLCNGAIYTASIYPALAAYLGSTFGGNGITTFGVPDFQSRVMLPIDFGATGRISTPVAGFNGAVFGATGGDQNPQAHTHTATSTVTDPGHHHQFYSTFNNAVGARVPLGTDDSQNNFFDTTSSTTGVTVSTQNATALSGASGNVQPSMVGGMRFIKT